MQQRQFTKLLRQQMTEAEALLWRHLRAHRLNGAKFKRQQALGVYVVDFVNFEARIIVEADGGQHNESRHDAVRDAWLAAQGFTVLRFWNNEVLGNIEGVLVRIAEALAAASPSPPAPLAPGHVVPQGERGANQRD